MKTAYRTGSVSALIILGFNSCCKEGTDGDATLTVYLKHHNTIIENHVSWPDTVFVKFNADELPGTNPSDFDAFFVGEAGEDHVHIKNLACGKYYLYGAGLDSSGPYRVTGGMGIKIKRKDRKELINVDLSVVE
ncbi:MAG: hypothetical protein FD123_4057 [Bacteroidetes bacterium]|nr:MAG: hypothetical protein FD123_4057 [Bacteroidota bacterium]